MRDATRNDAERPAGRRASTEVLRQRLRRASPEFLAGALDNPRLGRTEMRLFLGNPGADAAALRRIAEDSRWMRHGDLRRRVAGHPQAPTVLARRLVAGLAWKEQAELLADLHAPPRVRRDAERALRGRVTELTLGERIALARCPSRAILGALLASTEGQVLRSLLDNPRLTEPDVELLARATHVPPTFLRQLSQHPRWGGRRAIRLSLLRNPRTPSGAALDVARRLDRSDLHGLATDERTPRLVRVAVERWLTPRPGPGRRR